MEHLLQIELATAWPLLFAGFVGGLFGSLLGLGGGWLIVPTLLVLGAEPAGAVGTSLAAIIIASLVSVRRYAAKGLLDWRLGALFGLCTLPGVEMAKRLMVQLAAVGLDEPTIKGLYVILLTSVAVTMLRDRIPGAEDTPPKSSRLLSAWGPSINLKGGLPLPFYAIVGTGFAAGLVSGALGIGGGIFLVPVMVRLLKMPMLTSVAASLLCILMTSSYGALRYAAAGHVDIPLALLTGSGALIGSYVGTSQAQRVPEKLLRRLFAGLALGTAASVSLRYLRYNEASRLLLFSLASILTLVLFVRQRRIH